MRRFLFLILVAALLSYGYHRWKQMSRPGGRRVAEQYTPVVGPKIDLKDVPVLAALDAEYVRLIDTIVPSVVSVSLRGISRQNPAFVDPFDFFFRGRRGQPSVRMKTSLGSGVIVSKEGHILTNHHVVDGSGDIDVQLTDGRVEAAQLIGSDEVSDIALIKINGRDITPLPLGDSDAVRVGQMVFAVGNPFGLHETVTQGIISAKGRRTMRDSSVEFLQTDAAVNKGNSGGPLLNLRGEIIGINSAIYSETGGWAGISFAIPSNTARRALESLIKIGRVVRTYLGVAMDDLSPEVAQTLGLHDARGALIMEVFTGSPAEKAGLKRDDVIRKFNGRPVDDTLALRSRVADVDPGTKIELTILRAGKEQTVSAEITEAPADFASVRARVTPPSGSAPSPPPRDAPENVLSSIQVDEIPASVRERLPENVTGVFITQLQPNTDASSKLQPGDVIEEINRQQVPAVDDFVRISRTLQPDKTALLYIVRGRSRKFVVISP